MTRHLPFAREFRNGRRSAESRFHVEQLLSHLRVCAAIAFVAIVTLLMWQADVAWPLG